MSAVVMYKTNYCGYCVAARQFLKRSGIECDEIDVSQDAERRAWLVQATGQRTVPQIFVHGQSIGGYEDLVTLARSGKLAELLKQGS